ncbi:MAG: hypothetical protein HY202_07045 [Nitrospirae bacterium]|nr:hypothetical protein [Nitrospirota bacterium]
MKSLRDRLQLNYFVFYLLIFNFHFSLFTFFARPLAAEETPSGALSHFSYSGYFRQETAMRIYNPVVFTKIMSVLRIEAHYTFSPKFQLTVIPWVYYDIAPDLAQIDSLSRIIGPRTVLTDSPSVPQIAGTDVGNLRGVDIENKNAEFRELYLDAHFSALDLRLGRQIVRWGVVEGARILDEINPLDFKEFILREVADRYLPRWMVKSDLYLGEWALEGLYIPDLKFHKPAPKASQFEQFQILPGTTVPKSNLENADWGIRLSKPLFGADLAVSYYYMWDPFPASYRSVFGLGGFGVSPDVVFQPRYTKVRVYGGTLSKSFGKLILNAEGALVRDKYFGTLLGVDPADPAQFFYGEIKRNYLKYAVGADFTLYSADISLSMQQQKILNYDPNIIQREYDTVLSLFARKPLRNDRLVPSILVLYFLVDNDYLVRPKIEYGLTDRFKLSFGLDLMVGDIGGPMPGEFTFVGFFKNESRMEFDLTYSF